MKNLILVASFLVFSIAHADETKKLCGKIKNLEISDSYTVNKFEIGNRRFEINGRYKPLSIQALIAARISETKICIYYSQDELGINQVDSVKL